MTLDRAVRLIVHAEDKFFDLHRRRRKCSSAELHELMPLCDRDLRELCAALDARCECGKTDPLECLGVLTDAIHKALDKADPEKNPLAYLLHS